MSSVRKLTQGGGGCRTIVTVIHQPSSEVYELFDKLCLLASGDVAYFGDANKAADTFASVGLPVPVSRSAPDHFLHCINKDFETEEFDARLAQKKMSNNITVLVDTYKNSNTARAVEEHVNSLHENPGKVFEKTTKPPGWLYQTAVL